MADFSIVGRGHDRADAPKRCTVSVVFYQGKMIYLIGGGRKRPTVIYGFKWCVAVGDCRTRKADWFAMTLSFVIMNYP